MLYQTPTATAPQSPNHTATALVRMYEAQAREDRIEGPYLSPRTLPTNDIPVISASTTLPTADTDAAAKYISLAGRSSIMSNIVDINFKSEIDSLESWICGFNRGLLCRWRYDMYRLASCSSSYTGSSANGNQDNNLYPQMSILSNGVYSDIVLVGDVLFITGTNSSRFSIWVNDRLLTKTACPAGTGITIDASEQIYYPSNSNRQYIKIKFPTVDTRNIRIFHFGGGGIGDFYVRTTHTVYPRYRKRLNWLHLGDGHSSTINATNAIQTTVSHMSAAFGTGIDLVNACVQPSGWSLNTPGSTPNWLERWDQELKLNRPMDVVTLFGSYGDGGRANLPSNVTKLISNIKEAWPQCEIIVANTVIASQINGGTDASDERTLLAAAEAAGASIIRTQTDPQGKWLTGTGSVSTPAGNGNADLYGSGSALSAAGHVYYGKRWARGIYEAMRDKIGV